MNPAHHIDGNLPAARRALSDAIHNLVGRTRHTLQRDTAAAELADLEQRHQRDLDRIARSAAPDHVRQAQKTDAIRRYQESVVALTAQVTWGDSLYQQLRDSLTTPGAETRTSAASSQPPVWVDAADLLTTIDRRVATEEPGVGDTITRLHRIDDRTWRPQDVDHIIELADLITGWTERIHTLLQPPARHTLPNPCPACGTTVVYRRDSAGDYVRQPALHIGPRGCECQACHHMWAPDQLLFLARVLEYQLPAGVLE